MGADIQQGLSVPVRQFEFAQVVGISEAAVSQMKSAGVLREGGTLLEWLQSYITRLREQAAGRLGVDGAVDLPRERALLAREQRDGQAIKNAVARGAYAPIGLLSDVLANAAQAVVDRLDQIPAALRRQCPDLPGAALDAVMAEVASARNQMARKAESLVGDVLDQADLPVEEEPPADPVDEADA